MDSTPTDAELHAAELDASPGWRMAYAMFTSCSTWQQRGAVARLIGMELRRRFLAAVTPYPGP